MNIYNHIDNLLKNNKYQNALMEYKDYIEETLKAENFSSERLEEELKGKKILINTTGDDKINKFFCQPLIQLIKEKHELNLKNYLLLCTYINDQIEILLIEVDNLCSKLKESNQIIALYKILNSFENIHHSLMQSETNNLYDINESMNIFNGSVFENMAEALNILLEQWCKISLTKEFKKRRLKKKEIFQVKPSFINEDNWNSLVNLNFLYGLTNEIKFHDMEIENKVDHTDMYYIDKYSFIRHRLPPLREHFLNKKTTYEVWQNEEFLNKIDYERIMDISPNGEHFSLKLYVIQDIYGHLFNSIKIIEIEAIKIAKEFRIKDFSKIYYGDINMKEAFIFYMCIRNLADIYSNATNHFIKSYKRFPLCPFLGTSTEYIYMLYSNLLSKLFDRPLTKSDFEKWISFFTFGENEIFDLFYKPLIKCDNVILIVPSIILKNNFYRTFIKHLQLLKLDLSLKGTIFESENRALFKKVGLNIYNENYTFHYYSLKEKKDISGDIDVIAWDENYLFLAEVKNHLDPISHDDYRSAENVLKKAYNQIQKILLYVEERRQEFCNTLGISEEEFDRKTLVPFIVVSGFYRSGEEFHGVKITDYNSLEKFIEDGFLSIKSNRKTFVEVPLRGEINAQELDNFLQNPYYYGLEGCYGPRLYQENIVYMPSGTLKVSPRFPELNLKNHKFGSLYPNEETVKGWIDGAKE